MSRDTSWVAGPRTLPSGIAVLTPMNGSYPFNPVVVIPSVKYFCVKK